MLQQVRQNIFLYPHEDYTDRPNIMILAGKKKTLVFDGGNSAAHVREVQNSLKEKNIKEPDYIVVSHAHWDHSFGLHAWNCTRIAGKDTNKQLKKMQRWRWDDYSMEARINMHEEIDFCNQMIKREYPDRSQICVCTADVEFTQSISIDLGDGLIAEIMQIKSPHSADSVICYVPKERIAFLGDSYSKDFYSKEWKYDSTCKFSDLIKEIPYDGELLAQYITTLEKLDFTHCIGGHSDMMTREELFNLIKL